MILGVVLGISEVPPNALELDKIDEIATYNNRQVLLEFFVEFPGTMKDVGTSLGAILAFFLVFQLATRRFKTQQLRRILVGFVYTFLGLVVFLTGVEVGFIPVASIFGSDLGASPLKWVLIPLAMVIGYFIVAAEPAVHVLNKQVEEVSQGAIAAKTMAKALAIGMALALGIAMARILFHLNLLYILVPGYAFALALAFFVPPIFTGIAFDAGGVCSGPMTSTFLLPFTIGACATAGHMEDAFGIIAVVAMTPLVVVQMLGLIYRKRFAVAEAALAPVRAAVEDVIVTFKQRYVYA
jgi:hypothetical protein